MEGFNKFSFHISNCNKIQCILSSDVSSTETKTTTTTTKKTTFTVLFTKNSSQITKFSRASILFSVSIRRNTLNIYDTYVWWRIHSAHRSMVSSFVVVVVVMHIKRSHCNYVCIGFECRCLIIIVQFPNFNVIIVSTSAQSLNNQNYYVIRTL